MSKNSSDAAFAALAALAAPSKAAAVVSGKFVEQPGFGRLFTTVNKDSGEERIQGSWALPALYQGTRIKLKGTRHENGVVTLVGDDGTTRPITGELKLNKGENPGRLRTGFIKVGKAVLPIMSKQKEGPQGPYTFIWALGESSVVRTAL